MRVVYAPKLRGAGAVLHQHGVGPRGDGELGQVASADLRQLHIAMRRRVIDAQVAIGIRRQKALPEVLRGQIGDGGGLRVKIARLFQGVIVFAVADRKPLRDAALGVAHHEGNAAAEKRQADYLHRRGQGLNPLHQHGGGLVADIVVGDQPALLRHIELPLLHIQQQVSRLVRGGELAAHNDDVAFIAQQRLFPRQVDQQQASVFGQRGNGGLLLVGLRRDQPQRLARPVYHYGRLAQGPGHPRQDDALVVGIGHCVLVRRQQGAPVFQTQSQQPLRRGASGKGGEHRRGAFRQRLLANHAAIRRVEKRRAAIGGNAQADLTLLFHRVVQGAGLRAARRGISRDLLQARRHEHGQHHIKQIDGDQHQDDDDADASQRHPVAHHGILEVAPAAMLLRRRRLEVREREPCAWRL